jgi:hypothetical protein
MLTKQQSKGKGVRRAGPRAVGPAIPPAAAHVLASLDAEESFDLPDLARRVAGENGEAADVQARVARQLTWLKKEGLAREKAGRWSRTKKAAKVG